MSVSAGEIPDKAFLQTVGDRRSIRYYDPDKKVEDWKIQTILQTARFASCQGNINATEAIVVQKESCDIWDEIEVRLGLQRPDDQPGLAHHLLVDEPERLVRPRQRRPVDAALSAR